jgi:pimeloyl-ACP methyl ester carboxylesterase
VAEHSYRDGWYRVPDGLRLHYRDYPGSVRRPPLLCLAGLTRNARDFADFAQRVSPRFRVIALDFRGRGESEFDPLPARYNPLTYAGDVLHLLDDLAIDEAIFVGTSLGGLVTMILGTIAPHRVGAAILNDVGPELEQAGLDRIKGFVGKDVRFKTWEEAGARVVANNLHLPATFSPDDWSQAARRVCREENGEIRYDYDMAIANVFSDASATPKVDLWPMFATLAQKPLMLVRGERSDLLSAAALERMKQAAPEAQSVVVPGVGHAPILGEPEAVVAIDHFLGSIAP